MAALVPEKSPWTRQPLAREVQLQALMAVLMLHGVEPAADVLVEPAAGPGAEPEVEVPVQEVVSQAA
jgi:hypothetical protein